MPRSKLSALLIEKLTRVAVQIENAENPEDVQACIKELEEIQKWMPHGSIDLARMHIMKEGANQRLEFMKQHVVH